MEIPWKKGYNWNSMTKIIVTKSGKISTVEGANSHGTVIEVTGDPIDKIYYGNKEKVLKTIRKENRKKLNK